MKILSALFLFISFQQSAFAGITSPTCETKFDKVATDLKEFDESIALLREEEEPRPKQLDDINWVKRKLAFMWTIDQFTRRHWSIPEQRAYSIDERKCFKDLFYPRNYSVDVSNTIELKEILEKYDWISISRFGEKADQHAWLIVQHADQDSEFQKLILKKLETLYPLKETDPSNYAFLFDRIAASWNDESKRVPQRYGTQGQCVGPWKWQPIEIEDPEQLDARRASVGLPPFDTYLKVMNSFCK